MSWYSQMWWENQVTLCTKIQLTSIASNSPMTWNLHVCLISVVHSMAYNLPPYYYRPKPQVDHLAHNKSIYAASLKNAVPELKSINVFKFSCCPWNNEYTLCPGMWSILEPTNRSIFYKIRCTEINLYAKGLKLRGNNHPVLCLEISGIPQAICSRSPEIYESGGKS